MRNYIISTDSTMDLPKEFMQEHNVMVHPLNYIIDETEYGEGKEELSSKEFYDVMRNGKMPSTCASNPEYILELMKKKVEEGFDILHISFSSAMSSSYNNVCVCANEIMEEYPESKIAVVDSLAASSGQGLLVVKAVMMKEEGKTLEEVREYIEEKKHFVTHSFTVEDLFHLMRGGRLSRTSAIVGTVLKVKPVLHVSREGKLENVAKVRGRKKSLDTLLETLFNGLDESFDGPIIITDADCEEDATYTYEKVKAKYPEKNIMRSGISPTIGAHSGPGTMLISFMGKEKRQEI